MGWVIAVCCIVLFFVVIKKSIDKETTKNIKFLAKVVGGVMLLILVLGIFNSSK